MNSRTMLAPIQVQATSSPCPGLKSSAQELPHETPQHSDRPPRRLVDRGWSCQRRRWHSATQPQEAEASHDAAGMPDTVSAAFAALENASDWRQRKDAAKRLADLGDEALSTIRRGAKRHTNEEVREHCYSLLIERFPEDERAREVIYKQGLSDTSSGIRYRCAFSLGELKVFEAHRRLRHVMENPEENEINRYAAAKSLAQLGEPDAMSYLYDGLGSDHYMFRYLANLGIKALSGKNLNDFDYDYSEGALVSGGREAKRPRRPIEDNKLRASRYRALANYFRWLRDAHPELYKHVAGGF